MTPTKEKILTSAIALFNTRGLTSVTMKQIADDLKMSPGNLTYHYKTKALLLEEIYQRMDAESKDYILPGGYLTLHHFETMMMNYYEMGLRYRFFFQDVVHMVREYPQVGKMYEASNLSRFKEGRDLVDYYVETDRMVPSSPPIDYDKLVYTLWMLSAFWFSQEQIIVSERYRVNKVLPIEMLWQQLFPFLTPKGWEEYRQIKQYAPLP